MILFLSSIGFLLCVLACRKACSEDQVMENGHVAVLCAGFCFYPLLNILIGTLSLIYLYWNQLVEPME